MQAAQAAIPQFHGELISHQVQHIEGTKPRQYRTIFQYPSGVRELDDRGWSFYTHEAHEALAARRQAQQDA